jgi:hypothetical protein
MTEAAERDTVTAVTLPGPEERTLDPDQVWAVAGHMIDDEDRQPPRFPAHAEPRVTSAIRLIFERHGLGPRSLVVTSAARGTDIIAAEQALALGAHVWLLIPLPEQTFITISVALPGTTWATRYRSLRRRCSTWFLPGSDSGHRSHEASFVSNNRWCLDVACAQGRDRPTWALAVWDGVRVGDPGGTSDFVSYANLLGLRTIVIDPASPLTD